MVKAFELDEERSVLIYSRGSQLLFRVKQGEIIGRSVLVARDYEGNFEGIVQKNTIFYMYENVNQKILVKNINEANPIYHMEERASYCSLKLLNNRLLMIAVCEHDGANVLKIIAPLEGNASEILTSYEPMRICGINDAGKIYVEIGSKDNIKIYQIDSKFSATTFCNELSAKALEQENAKLKGMLHSATNQYNELMNVAEQYREEAIRWRSKFI